METVDYSSNKNFTNDFNNFLAENSTNLVNGNRQFNQFTSKFTDTCRFKQRLNLATKPMEYYVNSLNNISSIPNDENFLSFTPVGNAQNVNIANIFDRPIPSTLQTTSSVYTLPYSTSPFLGSSNNINYLDTDNDLTLKTGLELRNTNNQSDLSTKRWPTFGDIHTESMNVTVQNAGQHNNLSQNMSSINENIPGLNVTPNLASQGVGILALGGPNGFGISSTNMLRNIQNGKNLSCKEYKKLLNN